MNNLNLEGIKDVDFSYIDWHKHGGYKKFSTSKTILYKSNKLVTENNTEEKMVTSPIVNLSMSNGLLSYYIFDIEQNTMIEVTTYPSYEDIYIGTRTLNLESDDDEIPHSWIAHNFMSILSRKNKLSEDAVDYMKKFMNVYLSVNPKALDKYTTKFNLNIIK